MTGATGSYKNLVNHRLTIGSILFISILDSLLIVYGTKWGPWAFSDSTEYIYSARNLLDGYGLGLFGPSGAFHPSLLHPPFYSLVLSFFGLLGVDLLSAARWLGVVLFGLTILITGLSLYYLTSSAWLSITCSLLLSVMPALVDVSSGVMSELLFVFTGLAGLFLLLVFLRDRSWIFLIAAALASGLTMLTRYAGLGFILAGLCTLLVFDRGSMKRRLSHLVIYGVLGGLPTIGWLIWVRSQSLSVRTIDIPSNVFTQFSQLRLGVMKVFWSWIPFPSILPAYSYNLARNLLIIALLVLVLISGLLTFWMRKKPISTSDPANGLSITFSMLMLAVASLLVLGASYIFTRPTPDINSRILLPVQIAVSLGLFALLFFIFKALQLPRQANLIPMVLLVGVFFSNSLSTQKFITIYHNQGAGYTAPAYRQSKFIQAVMLLPPNIPLISNESALVLFYTGRPAYDITELADKSPTDVEAQYGADLDDPPQKAFRQQGAALVLFKSAYWQLDPIYGDQTATRLQSLTSGLTVQTQTNDGSIYFYPSPGQ